MSTARPFRVRTGEFVILVGRADMDFDDPAQPEFSGEAAKVRGVQFPYIAIEWASSPGQIHTINHNHWLYSVVSEDWFDLFRGNQRDVTPHGAKVECTSPLVESIEDDDDRLVAESLPTGFCPICESGAFIPNGAGYFECNNCFSLCVLPEEIEGE